MCGTGSNGRDKWVNVWDDSSTVLRNTRTQHSYATHTGTWFAPSDLPVHVPKFEQWRYPYEASGGYVSVFPEHTLNTAEQQLVNDFTPTILCHHWTNVCVRGEGVEEKKGKERGEGEESEVNKVDGRAKAEENSNANTTTKHKTQQGGNRDHPVL